MRKSWSSSQREISETTEPESGWQVDYVNSPTLQDQWRATQDPAATWPLGVRLHLQQMIWEGRMCIPENRVEETIGLHHRTTGNVGIKRLVNDLMRRYQWPDPRMIQGLAQKVRRECIVCQACEHPNWSVKAPIVPTPVPTHVMSRVALDIFSLPRVEWQGEAFDSLFICVDRLSGWIIARPTRKAGLTAKTAAHLIMDNGWETFGLPAVITSDQGPQFVGQWWRTMCARLGIRQGYSQAYRPQANGRAEVTGKVLIELMRTVWVEDRINWAEALPYILRVYHLSKSLDGKGF
jgi:transposase InsO family protein